MDYKILIIISNALGDFINFLPFLEHLNKNFENSKISIITKKYYFDIFKYAKNYIIDELVDIEKIPVFKLFSMNFNDEEFSFFKDFSLIISFTGTRNKIFRKNLTKINKNSTFIFPITQDFQKHEVEYLIESYPFKKRFLTKPKLELPESVKEYIAIHIGSGNKRKNVSLNFLLELSKSLNLPVKFFGGENEIYLKEKIDLEICYTIDDAVDILKKTYFYIGNDSGISHLAAAFDIPTFTFFGPTSFKVWKPYGEKSIVITKNMKCSPCDFNCKSNFECLNFNPKEISEIILNIYKNFFY